MKKLLIALLLFSSCSSNNDFEKGKKLLEQQGFSQIENTGHEWFCCDENDTYSTGFKCKNNKGQEITGCLCSSLIKGVTIRFN